MVLGIHPDRRSGISRVAERATREYRPRTRIPGIRRCVPAQRAARARRNVLARGEPYHGSRVESGWVHPGPYRTGTHSHEPGGEPRQVRGIAEQAGVPGHTAEPRSAFVVDLAA